MSQNFLGVSAHQQKQKKWNNGVLLFFLKFSKSIKIWIKLKWLEMFIMGLCITKNRKTEKCINGLAYRCKFNESISLVFKMFVFLMFRNIHHEILHQKNNKKCKHVVSFFLFRNGLVYKCKFDESISLRFKNVWKFSRCEYKYVKTEN
jgi:hypothetical protein